jgi:hypothetical protein
VRATLCSLAALLIVVTAGCSGTSQPRPTPTASPSPRALLPLDPGISGIPAESDHSVLLEPQSVAGTTPHGEPRDFQLQHCGLFSPIDIDGSLWDPIAGHNGMGGPLTEEQRTELVNSTPVTLTITAPDTIELVTPRGAVITLARHDGPRRYLLCA